MAASNEAGPSEMRTDVRHDTGRLEAFSDGVFAIAITILVLEIHVPILPRDAAPGDLTRALWAEWPTYAAFVTSFASILIVWMNHHGILQKVDRVDPLLMFTNGLLLLLTSLYALGTELVGRYLLTPAGSVAVATYAALSLGVNVAFILLWQSITHGRRLLKASVPDTLVTQVRREIYLGLPVYAFALGVSLVNAYFGLIVLTAIWVFWAVAGVRAMQTLLE